MTTYQHGQQPDGAPVTWYRGNDTPEGIGWLLHYKGPFSEYPPESAMRWKFCASIDGLEETCKAFHLAKLAAAMLESAPLTPHGTTDWLRRYREIAK